MLSHWIFSLSKSIYFSGCLYLCVCEHKRCMKFMNTFPGIWWRGWRSTLSRNEWHAIKECWCLCDDRTGRRPIETREGGWVGQQRSTASRVERGGDKNKVEGSAWRRENEWPIYENRNPRRENVAYRGRISILKTFVFYTRWWVWLNISPLPDRVVKSV